MLSGETGDQVPVGLSYIRLFPITLSQSYTGEVNLECILGTAGSYHISGQEWLDWARQFLVKGFPARVFAGEGSWEKERWGLDVWGLPVERDDGSDSGGPQRCGVWN